MKKQLQLLCATLFAATAFTAIAQTEGTDPTGQKLVIGENTVAAGTTNFTYDATENALIKLEGVVISSYSEMTATAADGATWNVKFHSYNDYYGGSGSYTAFYVEDGVNYAFSYDAREESTFNVVSYAMGPGDGLTCDEAIEMPESGQFLFNIPVENYWDPAASFYGKYTAPYEGKLRIVLDEKPRNFNIASSCSDDWITQDGDYSSKAGGYVYNIMLDAGEVVYLNAYGTDACMATYEYMEVVLGATCEDAFTINIGSNVIPAAAGTYYYKVTSPSSPSKSTLNVTSDAAASVTVSSSCVGSYDDKEYPSLNFTQTPVNANSTMVFTVVKETATAADETFNVAFENLKPIEDEEQGEPIEIGMEPATYNTPGTGSAATTFYYSFTAPEGDPLLLSITSTNAVSSSYYGPFVVKPLNGWSQLGSGLTINAQTEPGTTYILSVQVPADTPDGFDFTIVYKEIEPGSVNTYPIDAILGENSVPAFSPVYYSYKPEENHYLLLKSDLQEGGSLKVQISSSYYATDVPLTEVEGGYKFEAIAGNTYSIMLTDAVADSKLVLEELPYAEGESAKTAFQIEEGTHPIAESSNTWYKIAAPGDCFVTINTTLGSDYGNVFEIYLGAVKPENRNDMPKDPSASYPYPFIQFKKAVTEGEEVYVHIVNKLSPASEFTIEFVEAQEGEIAAKPIPIEYVAPSTEVTFPEVKYGDKRWYSIELPEGKLSMLANTMSSFTSELYTANDIESVLVYGGYQDSETYGIKDFVLPEAGKYLLCVTSNSTPDLKATFTVTDPLPGEASSTAIELDFTEVPYVLNLATSGLASTPNGEWYKFKVNPGELTIKGNDQKYFQGFLFKSDDFTRTISEFTTDNLFEDTYFYSMNVTVGEPDTYYLKIFNLSSDETTLTFSGSAIEPVPVKDTVDVTVKISNGEGYTITLPKNCGKFVLDLNDLPENWVVVNTTAMGMQLADATMLPFEIGENDIAIEFELGYEGELVFLDESVGVLAIDTKITMEIEDGAIVIKNTTVGDEIKVYNLAGMLMDQHIANNTQVRVTLDKGTYIVTVNQNAVKVVL